MEFLTSNGRIIELREGDITKVVADAIVNAANERLAGGGGVDGAIHRAGGPEIMSELDVIRRRIGRCRTGDAVLTGAGRLPARMVLHTVGPVYRDGKHGEPELLAKCYRTCLDMADEKCAVTVAFPAISTGVYGYPFEPAAEIAVKETVAHLKRPVTTVGRVIFVLVDHHGWQVYEAELRKALNLSRTP